MQGRLFVASIYKSKARFAGNRASGSAALALAIANEFPCRERRDWLVVGIYDKM